jgi:hypothetical protein
MPEMIAADTALVLSLAILDGRKRRAQSGALASFAKQDDQSE